MGFIFGSKQFWPCLYLDQIDRRFVHIVWTFWSNTAEQFVILGNSYEKLISFEIKWYELWKSWHFETWAIGRFWTFRNMNNLKGWTDFLYQDVWGVWKRRNFWKSYNTLYYFEKDFSWKHTHTRTTWKCKHLWELEHWKTFLNMLNFWRCGKIEDFEHDIVEQFENISIRFVLTAGSFTNGNVDMLEVWKICNKQNTWKA